MPTQQPHDSKQLGRRTFIQGVAAGAVGLGLSGALVPGARAEEGETATVQKVKTRVLGRTGREVSCIGVGGGGLNPQNANLLQAGWDHGINFIDVAYNYGRGQAEIGTGTFLEKFPHRDKLFVSTKASGFSPPRGTAKQVYEAFKARVQEQLARLKTDYVDLMMWPHGAQDTSFLANEAMQDAFRKLREEGLVKYFGTSSHKDYAKVGEAVAENGFYDVMLIVLNICSQNATRAGQPEEAPGGRRGRGRGPGRQTEDTTAFLKKAKAKNLGVMAMKVANDGFMTANTNALLAEAFPDDTGWSRHQKLYKYGLGMDGVSTVIVGMRSVLHLREAIAVGAV